MTGRPPSPTELHPEPAPPAPPRAPHEDTADRGATWLLRAQLVHIGVLGCLPVATVLGAVPGRHPTWLIEWMFSGFVRCALDGGALNPIIMTCPRAGVPVGMHQLDGGLTYPLGGLAVRMGLTPLTAWKLAVVTLLAVGFVALAWLAHRLTGSRAAAVAVVALLGFDATLTSRTWNWYWNTVAFALLPLLLLALLVLFDRARQRRPRALWAPGAAATAAVLLIAIEWQYAGLFATAVAGTALLVLVAQRRWTARQRAALLAVGIIAAGVVFAVLRLRLQLAGIATQFDESMLVAAEEGVDLVSLVVPDPQASFIGWLLAWATGAGLTTGLTEGRQLWVAPYLDVGLLVTLGALAVRRRSALRDDPDLPRGFITVLVLALAASVVLSLGPVWHVARLALPDAVATSPLQFLWTVTPLRWVRYPWTWNGLTTIGTLVLAAAVLPSVARRRDGRWSPLAWVVLVVAVLELGSPLVVGTLGTPEPSVETAPFRQTTTDPVVARFEERQLPELRSALARGGGAGPVMFLPWGNTWITPYLGAADGLRFRNVGIDRNVLQAEEAAPRTREQLRTLRSPMIDELFRSGWVDAVALIDFVPTGDKLERAASDDLLVVDVRERARVARAAREVQQLGYCTERFSWFTLVTPCDRPDRTATQARATGP